jgi:beta-lactamase class A
MVHLKKIFLALLLFPFLAFAQKTKTDHKLEQSLTALISGFKGTVGIYVMNLKTGKQAGINADSIFPTASIVKVPILVGLFDKIEKGELSYHQPLLYRDSIKYGGSGIMQFFKDSSATELSVLANLMMTYSDNTASLWNQRLAGGGARINEVLQQYGLKDTRINSRTKGREAIWKIYGWGQTTPREMATLLIKIRKGEIVSKAASERMYRLMTKGYYDENALSQIPPYIHAAAKSGSVNESRSEVVLVNAPHGDYVFYIGTKNIKDQSWTPENEGEQLIRKVSALLWNHFEPGSDWK